MYHIFCFTEWVPDEKVRYNIGYSCLLFNFLNLGFNLAQLLGCTVIDVFGYLKQLHARRKFFQNREAQRARFNTRGSLASRRSVKRQIKKDARIARQLERELSALEPSSEEEEDGNRIEQLIGMRDNSVKKHKSKAQRWREHYGVEYEEEKKPVHLTKAQRWKQHFEITDSNRQMPTNHLLSAMNLRGQSSNEMLDDQKPEILKQQLKPFKETTEFASMSSLIAKNQILEETLVPSEFLSIC